MGNAKDAWVTCLTEETWNCQRNECLLKTPDKAAHLCPSPLLMNFTMDHLLPSNYSVDWWNLSIIWSASSYLHLQSQTLFGNGVKDEYKCQRAITIYWSFDTWTSPISRKHVWSIIEYSWTYPTKSEVRSSVPSLSGYERMTLAMFVYYWVVGEVALERSTKQILVEKSFLLRLTIEYIHSSVNS
jgi:hypothetical protein